MHNIIQYLPLLNWLIAQEYLMFDYADPCAVVIYACSIHRPGFICPTVPLIPCVSCNLYLCNTVFDKNIFWNQITDYGFILTIQVPLIVACQQHTGLLFAKWTDVLPKEITKSRSCKIGFYNYHIPLKFDRHHGSDAAEVPVKFQINRKSLKPSLTAFKLHKILR